MFNIIPIASLYVSSPKLNFRDHFTFLDAPPLHLWPQRHESYLNATTICSWREDQYDFNVRLVPSPVFPRTRQTLRRTAKHSHEAKTYDHLKQTAATKLEGSYHVNTNPSELIFLVHSFNILPVIATISPKRIIETINVDSLFH